MQDEDEEESKLVLPHRRPRLTQQQKGQLSHLQALTDSSCHSKNFRFAGSSSLAAAKNAADRAQRRQGVLKQIDIVRQIRENLEAAHQEILSSSSSSSSAVVRERQIAARQALYATRADVLRLCAVTEALQGNYQLPSYDQYVHHFHALTDKTEAINNGDSDNDDGDEDDEEEEGDISGEQQEPQEEAETTPSTALPSLQDSEATTRRPPQDDQSHLERKSSDADGSKAKSVEYKKADQMIDPRRRSFDPPTKQQQLRFNPKSNSALQLKSEEEAITAEPMLVQEMTSSILPKEATSSITSPAIPTTKPPTVDASTASKTTKETILETSKTNATDAKAPIRASTIELDLDKTRGDGVDDVPDDKLGTSADTVSKANNDATNTDAEKKAKTTKLEDATSFSITAGTESAAASKGKHATKTNKTAGTPRGSVQTLKEKTSFDVSEPSTAILLDETPTPPVTERLAGGSENAVEKRKESAKTSTTTKEDPPVEPGEIEPEFGTESAFVVGENDEVPSKDSARNSPSLELADAQSFCAVMDHAEPSDVHDEDAQVERIQGGSRTTEYSFPEGGKNKAFIPQSSPWNIEGPRRIHDEAPNGYDSISLSDYGDKKDPADKSTSETTPSSVKESKMDAADPGAEKPRDAEDSTKRKRENVGLLAADQKKQKLVIEATYPKERTITQMSDDVEDKSKKGEKKSKSNAEENVNMEMVKQLHSFKEKFQPKSTSPPVAQDRESESHGDVDANGLRILTLEAVHQTMLLNQGKIQAKRLMKLLDVKKKSPRERRDTLRKLVKQICVVEKDEEGGSILVLKQPSVKGLKTKQPPQHKSGDGSVVEEKTATRVQTPTEKADDEVTSRRKRVESPIESDSVDAKDSQVASPEQPSTASRKGSPTMATLFHIEEPLPFRTKKTKPSSPK